MDRRPGPDVVTGVIFDFHGTLVDAHEPAAWIAAARQFLTDRGLPVPDAAHDPGLARHLHDIWTHADTFDPASTRDLSRERHRQVFARAVELHRPSDSGLIEALYAVMPRQWVPFTDAVPALQALRARGVRLVLLSNIGVDIRPQLARTGLAELLDDVVLSYEVGMVKPDPGIFGLALERLGRPASQALMVGDSAHADVGGTALGIRTLILPRTTRRLRGLDAVVRLVG